MAGRVAHGHGLHPQQIARACAGVRVRAHARIRIALQIDDDAAVVDFRCAGASHVVGHRGPQVAQRVRQGAARETARDIHHRPRRDYGRIGRRRGAARIDGGRVFAEIVYLR